MQKIIFIKRNNASFVITDQNILESSFRVRPFLVKDRILKFLFLFELMFLAFYLLFCSYKARYFVTWFSDYHAAIMVFIGNLLGKKTIIMAGGQEAVCYKELGKGAYQKKFRGKFVTYALKHASLIIPNHKSLIFHENFYYTLDGKKDGISYYIPDIKTKMEILSNGFDVTKFQREYSIKKNSKMILTIGRTIKVADIINKGFDLFVQVAERNPHLEFVIIAIKEEHIKWLEDRYAVSKLKNLTFIPYFCPDQKLHYYLNAANVFVQNSITEGMPYSLGEAMLYECIPVGSNVNGIPDLMGNTGVIVYHRTIEDLETAIIKAISLNTGKAAREHIVNNFSLERRKERIIQLIQNS